MTTEANIKIAVARSKLRDNYPFFGVLASELNIAPDSTGGVKTACISMHGNMLYNKSFVDSLSFAETMGLLAHESLHVVFELWDRIGERVFVKANLAHDYVINLIIQSTGLDLPKGVALDNRYRNQSFEEVYEQLKEPSHPEFPLNDDANVVFGDLADSQFPFTTSDNTHTRKEDRKEKWRNALYRAVKADNEDPGKSIRGYLPNDISLLIDDILYPPLEFSNRLQKYVGSWGRKSFPTFLKFNKLNCFEPLHSTVPAYNSNKGRVYVLVDTSGSMFFSQNKSLIHHALGCIENIASSIGMDVVLVTCDAALQQRITLREFRIMLGSSINLKGGGGSNFKSTFDELWQEISMLRGGAPIICFTDGDILVNDIQPRLKTETFWVTLSNQTPPTMHWGRHCPLDRAT